MDESEDADAIEAALIVEDMTVEDFVSLEDPAAEAFFVEEMLAEIAGPADDQTAAILEEAESALQETEPELVEPEPVVQEAVPDAEEAEPVLEVIAPVLEEIRIDTAIEEVLLGVEMDALTRGYIPPIAVSDDGEIAAEEAPVTEDGPESAASSEVSVDDAEPAPPEEVLAVQPSDEIASDDEPYAGEAVTEALPMEEQAEVEQEAPLAATSEAAEVAPPTASDVAPQYDMEIIPEPEEPSPVTASESEIQAIVQALEETEHLTNDEPTPEPVVEAEPVVDMPGYAAGESDIDTLTCADCVYVTTCPNKGERTPAACGSFQWVTT